MKGRFRVASEAHHFGEVCLTKCIGSAALVDLSLAGFALTCGLETRFSSFFLGEVSKLLQWVLALEAGWIPTSFFPEVMRAKSCRLALLSI